MLLKINKLSILKELFEKIVVPETVYKEITAKEHDKLIFDKLEWIKVRSARNIEMTALLEKLIDSGEAEAIVLARELSAILLIDDAKARKYVNPSKHRSDRHTRITQDSQKAWFGSISKKSN